MLTNYSQQEDDKKEENFSNNNVIKDRFKENSINFIERNKVSALCIRREG